jgi:putative ATP-binding cassette transporter
MNLWEFLRTHSTVPLSRVIAVAGIAGLSNALLLMIINAASHSATDDGSRTVMFRLLGSEITLSIGQLFLLFAIVITCYILTQRYILRVASSEVEKIIATIRVNLSDKIRQSDLHAIEGLGRAQLYGSLNADTITISQATAPMIIASQGSILVAFSLVYILVLSPAAFIMTLVIVALGIAIHFRNRKQLMAQLGASTAKEAEFFEGLTHLLDGFKEIKLNRRRSTGLFEHLTGIAGDVARVKTDTGLRYADYFIFTQVLFYLLIGAMVFILPAVSSVYSEQVTRITAAILFIIGPLTMVVGFLPIFRAANHSVANIGRLEKALEHAEGAARQREHGDAVAPPAFRTIEVQDLTFSYTDREGKAQFTLGPANLTIRQGEIVLIVGGNGSGKSTFLKLLTALYYPDSGLITLDGLSVGTLGYQSYRELFAAVLADYHLFDRLYGMADVDPRLVLERLREMQLDRKTEWSAGRFVQQELSTGQKKRLALIVALLEDRPIYVFDEWAADQDPEFRRYFYESLLPGLKAQGRTIVAATHDDRYFSIGDKVAKMELGKIVSLQIKGEA